MKHKTLHTLLALIAGIIIAATVATMSAQNRRPTWQYGCYNTMYDLQAGLNKMNWDAEVKIVVAPSERNYGGILGSPYCIFFRETP